MPKLLLIKHAKPLVDPTVPSHEWGLSDEGRSQCAALADRLRPHATTLIFSSDEPKAVETAELLAKHLNVPHQPAPGLHEHDRSDVPQMRTGEFISAMAHFFQHPTQKVLGLESAHRCATRFNNAVHALKERHPADTLAVVTHGTVLALHLADLTDQDPFQLWRRMQLPSYAVIDGNAVEIIHRI